MFERALRTLAEVDSGERPGVTTEAGEEIKRLKRENAELRRANETVKSESVSGESVLSRSRDAVTSRPTGP